MEVKLARHSITSSHCKDFFLINVGVLIMGLGIHFFKFPNHFVMGGVAGMSVVFSALLPSFSPTYINTVLNVVLLIIGFISFGKSFGVKTTYATVVLTAILPIFEKFIPQNKPMTDEPVLELFFAFLLTALGSAILFNLQASSGGTDIIAKLIKEHSSLDIGKALLATDAVFTLSTFALFGPKTGLFSCAGLLCKAFLVDSMIEGIGRVKCFTIITNKPDEIGNYINHELRRSATCFKGYGLYHKTERTVFICVVSRYQAVKLRNYIRLVDPQAFISITSTSEIVGKGFRSMP